jgi:2-polyprenyl-6-methoxyphenol hydroxylase-like FAD-dependent oxidoreductase
MLPTTGLGASNAFQDAVVLANCIFNMPDVSMKSITGAFEEYYRQRFRRAQDQFEDSNVMAKTMLGQVRGGHLFFYAFVCLVYKMIPGSKLFLAETSSYAHTFSHAPMFDRSRR